MQQHEMLTAVAQQAVFDATAAENASTEGQSRWHIMGDESEERSATAAEHSAAMELLWAAKLPMQPVKPSGDRQLSSHQRRR